MVIIVVIVNILNTVIPKSDLAAIKENELILNYPFLQLRPTTRYYDAFFFFFLEIASSGYLLVILL